MDKLLYSLTVSKNGIKQATLTVDTCNQIVNVRSHNTFKDSNLGPITSAAILQQFGDVVVVGAMGELIGV